MYPLFNNLAYTVSDITTNESFIRFGLLYPFHFFVAKHIIIILLFLAVTSAATVAFRSFVGVNLGYISASPYVARHIFNEVPIAKHFFAFLFINC